MLKGHCRRYPPNVVMDTPEIPYLNDGWPTVHAQSWCGEYRRGRVSKDVIDVLDRHAGRAALNAMEEGK